MIRSLFSGVAGLKAHQTRMDVVGNNIANVNTTGFKASRVTFGDTLYQTMSGASAPTGTRGGTNGKQVGLGVGVSTIDTLFSDASASQTGNNTDLALSGNGLFVVKQGSETYYTRDGSFTFDEQGNYVLPGSGKYVQGWMADSDGNLATTGGTVNIVVRNDTTMDPKQTTTVTYMKNLDAGMSANRATRAEITYEDGNKETVTDYVPIELGTIWVKDSNGDIKDYTIERTDATASKYATGDQLNATQSTDAEAIAKATIWTSKVTSATLKPVAAANLGAPESSVTVGLLGANAPLAMKIESTDANGTKTAVSATTQKFTSANGLAAGSYELGKEYPAITKKITKATLNADNTVELEFAAGTDGIVSVTVPQPTNGGSYGPAGSGATKTSFDIKLTITDITAATGDKITCANGESATLAASVDPTTVSVGSDYAKRVSGEVVRVNDHTGARYNGKDVASITVYDEDGNFETGDKLKNLKDQTVAGSVVTPFDVHDSEGGKTSMSMLLKKTADNTWQALLPGGGMTYSGTRGDGVKYTATLEATNIVFDTNAKYVSGSGKLTMMYENGRPADQTVNIDFSQLTQYGNEKAGSDAATNVNTVYAESDGYTFGSLASVSVDSSGVISGVFSNGEHRNLAQVAVAQFNNAAGLTRVGNNFFQVSNNSGAADVSTADALNCTITPSSLEMSNVDLANEFSNMIITQRGYQSNSKMITVSDEMLETLINMKR